MRVERFENIMATVFPAREVELWPDLMSRLALAALRTRAESSEAERSAIDSRCRGVEADLEL